MSALLEEELTEQRRRLRSALGLSEESLRPVVDDLVCRYGAPDRHYHNIRHVVSVLETVCRLAKTPTAPLLLAAWYHDAVYDSRAADNEERSVALLRTTLPRLR